MKSKFDENLYGVFDDKVGSFRFKFFASRNKAAEREFSDSVNNPKSVFNAHPEDFSLFLLAEFDTDSGLSQAIVPPQHLGRASDFLNPNRPIQEVPCD